MNYEISFHNDGTIILVTHKADFDLGRDMQAVGAELIAILEPAERPLALIMDVRDVRLDFGSIVAAMAASTRDSSDVFGHPNLGQFVFITENSLVRLAAKAFAQEQYGGIHVSVAATLEEALASIAVEA